MALKLANNAATTLSSAVTSLATSITVVDGSSFPALGVADHTYITLATPDASKVEVVEATAILGNTITIVRGQDNTTPQIFSAGDLCELRVTAAILQAGIQTGAEIKSLYELEPNAFTDAQFTKLDGLTDTNLTTEGLFEMANTISSDYTIGVGNNAISAGPITVASGSSVTIPTGSTWVIS